MTTTTGDNDFNYVLLGLFMAMGAYFFAVGWRKLRRKRLLKNIPASKIGSAAMGLCELTGEVRSDLPLTTQLTGRSAVWRRLRISYVARKAKPEFALLDVSSAAPFKIDDGTGWVIVAPKEAQLSVSDPAEWVGSYREANDARRAIIDRHDSGSLFSDSRKGSGAYAIQEWAIETGQTVFVLGCATPPDGLQGAGCKAVIKPEPREKLLILSTTGKPRLDWELGSAALAALIGGPLFFLLSLALFLGKLFGW